MPLPSCPFSLNPQQYTPPAATTAQACPLLAAIAVMSARPVTGTGVGELVVVPLPSDPEELLPQHSTVRSAMRTQLEVDTSSDQRWRR